MAFFAVLNLGMKKRFDNVLMINQASFINANEKKLANFSVLFRGIMLLF